MTLTQEDALLSLAQSASNSACAEDKAGRENNDIVHGGM